MDGRSDIDLLAVLERDVDEERLATLERLHVGFGARSAAFRRAVLAQLRAWPEHVRSPVLAYVPAAQGYAVVTVCRALHALETGEQTTKEEAAAWAAERFAERADEIRAALAAHRADLGAAHARTVELVDFAAHEPGF